MKRAGRWLFNFAAVVSLVLSAATVVMWVRSYNVGDYVRLGPNLYLSFARGYCRIVPEEWFFVGNYPVVGSPIVNYPIDKVGDYPGTSATYVPLWLLTLFFLACAAVALRTNWLRPEPGFCTVCGYDLRATPDRCPECGAIPPAANGAAR
jgi:hypothetical protein